ncbi:hypothetical protein [Streptococcus thoraltensis]
MNHFVSTSDFKGVILIHQTTREAIRYQCLSAILPDGKLFSTINKYSQINSFTLNNNTVSS